MTTGPSPASKGEPSVRGPVPEGGISSVPGAQLSHPRRVSRARSRLGVGGVSRVCPLACANASRSCTARSSCRCSPSQLHSLFLGLGDAFLGFLWSARRRLLRGPCQPCASPAPSCTLSPARGRHYPPHALPGQKWLWSKDPVSPRLLSAASNASQPKRAKDVRGREEPRVHPGTRDKRQAGVSPPHGGTIRPQGGNGHHHSCTSLRDVGSQRDRCRGATRSRVTRGSEVPGHGGGEGPDKGRQASVLQDDRRPGGGRW